MIRHSFMGASLAAWCLFGLHIVVAQDVKVTEKSQLSAVQAADDARVAAMKEPQKEKLSAIFSDQLHYAHSTGSVDTKASLIEALLGGKTKYLEMKYEKRDFTFPAPAIALMTGRVKVKVATADATIDTTLSFLAVWRLENGNWKFIAWQSCKLPPPTT